MGFGSSLVAWSLGPLLQQAWGPTSNKGVRTMGLTVGLKFKAQMGLEIPCHTKLFLNGLLINTLKVEVSIRVSVSGSCRVEVGVLD